MFTTIHNMHMYTLHLLSAIYFWNVKFLGHFHSLSSAVAHLHMEGTQRNANIHPEHKNTTTQNKHKLEMWANAQRDGRPAKYRWRSLFNAAKFG